ncbi:MAG: glutamine-hydrolyzing carbamoyl-phosphate synthase small subunit [Prolixibacteraceae bacterium]|jgi:carbamoyl-phosphate synthase small subunit|nr:glutamine-hydrolyzing carbamoyl-phosphate synthase small subunit [Prolixibacteraceae bacterium]MBT6764162.1 glutamine-hydrolyzing carbamoyl-phosphate synthase small subunit [Prolixibacteraceae bacterium]MBT6998611.1 glutamine-hydrolyzing carbamoyl-phosphate synthase small subunit [Prolixibacteraceae bacterium]MBT7397412.1 glutamine-hydrolyzing carbamoyl-phosphate synthase small subunit [Prolixibacteraceae bacterium]
MLEVKKAKLTLEDGTVFTGKSFGSETAVAGEVVFYTAMTGYPESLTDPSYTGQILVSTYPMIGNYGVPFNQKENGIHKHYESNKLHISGLIVSDYSFEFSHWNAEKSLADWLKEYNVPGLFDIDTRALTKILREKGSMLGKIEFEKEIEFYDPNKENLVAVASCEKKEVYGDGEHKVVLIDCGVKNNIIRCLLERNSTVIRVPWNYDFSNEKYDGVFVSNGPGDPVMCAETVENVKKVIDEEIPIMGICLGNQLLARAAGAETYKLKYGHRSHNQPVLLHGTNKCYITSQNHGFAVETETLPENWEPLFTNVNDETNEGIKHKTLPFFSTQFHPEASSGPTDTEFLFDDFISSIEKSKK